MIAEYYDFLRDKEQLGGSYGFEPVDVHDFLFDFQKYLVSWAVRKGRCAIFADCGMGKTAIQISYADNVARHTNQPVLIVTPLAVSQQTVAECHKFGIEAKRSRDGRIDSSAKIWVTNYEQLEKFDPVAFAGVIADESSAIKDFNSKRRDAVTEFMRTRKYRLLATATAAPNDYHELGTSSEAIGELGFRDMITKFFVQETSDGHAWGRTKYRFRGHAVRPFWRWVCSWARACRRPSDIGFSDERFNLPPLIETEYEVVPNKLRSGMLFALPAETLQDQREERRNSVDVRCQKAADIVAACDGPSVVWCHLNDEGDRLEDMIDDGLQVSGSMSDEAKEERLVDFAAGRLRVLITKPKIGCWGLNWQHCSNIVMFPSHSFEQYYQAVRRCWRFGQKSQVNVSIIASEGEMGVLKNLQRKAKQADDMFDSLVREMHNELSIVHEEKFPNNTEVPSWLSSTK